MISIPTIGFAKGDTLQKNQDPFETESKNYSTIGEILPLVKPDSVEDSIKKPSVLLHEVVKGDTLYALDRKSTRLNSSHVAISYAVFCLKTKTAINSLQR